jgi:hypothetical protein
MKNIRVVENQPTVIHDEEAGGYVYPEEYIGEVIYCKTNKSYYYIKNKKDCTTIDAGTINIIEPLIKSQIDSKFQDLNIAELERAIDDLGTPIEELEAFTNDIHSSLKKKIESLKKDNKSINDSMKKIEQNILNVVEDRVAELSDDIISKIETMKTVAGESPDGSSGGNLTVTKLVMLVEAGFKPKDIATLAPFIK